MKSMLDLLWKPWWAAARQSLEAMESILLSPQRGVLSLLLLTAGTVVSWFLYVPVHELLHALGCFATGGSVSELNIQARYGGVLLEKIFPFVVAGGSYAGQLTGFDTGGSDLVYLATVAAPYLLTLLGGFWLLTLATTHRSALLFGPAVVLLMAPLLSLAGDYYEMGSIVVSGILGLLGGPPESLKLLRHDDLFALLSAFGQRFPERRALWAAAVTASALMGYTLACLTLAGSRVAAGWFQGPRRQRAWLSPIQSPLSSLLAHLYYRLKVVGEPLPRRGPVILVANHNSALLDPVMLSVASRRPVRFLAKAPLFTDSSLRVLVRAAGSIPVYRQKDDASQIGRNAEMFQAVMVALSEGSILGLFPEGRSHRAPSVQPLRTGAARIALEAFALHHTTFPIIPVGLMVRHQGKFRSPALILRGKPVAWEDLAACGAEDRLAVRRLTDRIHTSLRQVTLELEHWEDRPLVECAEAIWTAEYGGNSDPAAAMRRLRRAARILGELRRQEGPYSDVLRQVEQHRRKLQLLGLQPAHLSMDTRWTAGLRRALRTRHLLGFPAALLAVAGYLLFRIPYGIAGALARLRQPQAAALSSRRVLAGVPVYLLWVVGLCITIGWLWGPWPAAAAALWIPATGLSGLWFRERWQVTLRDLRRFLVMRRRREQVTELKSRQADLAERLKELYQRFPDQSLNL